MGVRPLIEWGMQVAEMDEEHALSLKGQRAEHLLPSLLMGSKMRSVFMTTQHRGIVGAECSGGVMPRLSARARMVGIGVLSDASTSCGH